MKILTLMRHGEAEHGLGQVDDFSRKLSGSGKERLKILNGMLVKNDQKFDLLIKSPARRANETAKLITYHLKIDKEESEPAIYEGSVEKLLEILKHLSDEFDNVLLVGHNPGISSLLVYLTNEINISLWPGMMAIVNLDIPNWDMLTSGTGSLKEVLQ